MHTEPYIDPNIQITEHIPSSLQYEIRKLEEQDKTGSILYFDWSDNFCVSIKNAYAAGGISKETWDLLEQKYVWHANYIADKEDGLVK